MQRRFSTLSLLLLCSISSAMATEWTSIIKNDDYEVFVDIDSYNVEGNAPYMTSKTIFKKPQTHLMNEQQLQYTTSIKSMQFDCAQPQFKTKSLALYDKENKLLTQTKKASKFEKITPNTQAFSVGQLTCQVHQMLGGQ